MSLPISTIANISISSTPKLSSRTGFGTLCGHTMELGDIDTAERVRFYSDAASVITDFPVALDGVSPSEIGILATTYFSQKPAPTSFAVGMRYESNQLPTLYCDPINSASSISESGGISNFITSELAGLPFTFQFTITPISGTPTTEYYTITFGAGITTGAEVAYELQAVLDAGGEGTGTVQDILVSYEDSATVLTTGYSRNRFVFESVGGSTAGDQISYITAAQAGGTDLSSVIGGAQGSGYRTAAFAGESVYDSLNANYEVNSSWYGIAFTKEVVDTYTTPTAGPKANAVLDAAFWAAGISATSPKTFFNQTFDESIVDRPLSLATHISKQLKDGNYQRTLSSYCSDGSSYGAVSAAAYAFTWNPAATNSHYTLKFKQMPTIPTEELSTNQKNNIDATYCNAVIDVGGDPIYAEGFVQNGLFFDTIHGLDWLENALETNVYNYLKAAASKRPASGVGQSGIEQAIRSGLEEAVTNGFIGAGYGIDGTYYPLGYKIIVPTLSLADKQSRQSTGITFTAIGTGALHGVQVTGTYEE